MNNQLIPNPLCYERVTSLVLALRLKDPKLPALTPQVREELFLDLALVCRHVCHSDRVSKSRPSVPRIEGRRVSSQLLPFYPQAKLTSIIGSPCYSFLLDRHRVHSTTNSDLAEPGSVATKRNKHSSLQACFYRSSGAGPDLGLPCLAAKGTSIHREPRSETTRASASISMTHCSLTGVSNVTSPHSMNLPVEQSAPIQDKRSAVQPIGGKKLWLCVMINCVDHGSRSCESNATSKVGCNV